MVKRDEDNGSHHHENEPSFASDDEETISTFSTSPSVAHSQFAFTPNDNGFRKGLAIRVKRVSRAGSSHKPRVMNKNKGNSRAGQTDTVPESQ
ncbi:unnamed protein product [Heligmosomoides polygyrus]|uniref:Uncharacterized protein n=1 Tax=Heligmosomoides polygyrus TaxID=6339 RepID=A0A3P8BMQ5_HELPZ|nr:unnamed protein product [Heligmosomoides polygyrus]